MAVNLIEVALAKSHWYVTVLYCIVGVGTCAMNTDLEKLWWSQEKYTHVDKFSEDEYNYALLLEVESTSIDQSACICYSCSKQIKRNTNNPNFYNFQPR